MLTKVDFEGDARGGSASVLLGILGELEALCADARIRQRLPAMVVEFLTAETERQMREFKEYNGNPDAPLPSAPHIDDAPPTLGYWCAFLAAAHDALVARPAGPAKTAKARLIDVGGPGRWTAPLATWSLRLSEMRQRSDADPAGLAEDLRAAMETVRGAIRSERAPQPEFSVLFDALERLVIHSGNLAHVATEYRRLFGTAREPALPERGTIPAPKAPRGGWAVHSDEVKWQQWDRLRDSALSSMAEWEQAWRDADGACGGVAAHLPERVRAPWTEARELARNVWVDELRAALKRLYGLAYNGCGIGVPHDDPAPWLWPADQAEPHLAVVRGAADVLGTMGDGAGGQAGESEADDGYRPAKWFGKGLAARLRMAAGPKRKTMQVRTKLIAGTRCYNVADARQWWGDEVPR